MEDRTAGHLLFFGVADIVFCWSLWPRTERSVSPLDNLLAVTGTTESIIVSLSKGTLKH